MGNLGVISLNDGSLLFEPAASSAVTMRYMGLDALGITPLAAEAPAVTEEVEDVPARRNYVSLSLKIAASLIIAIMACGVFFTTDNLIGGHSTNYASLDSGLRSHVSAASLAPVQEELSLSREIQLNIAMPAPESVEAVPQNTLLPALESSDRYLLVVASFSDMKSARKHIGNDTRLSVIEMDGNFRVCVASAENISKAHQQADVLRDEFPYIWICRR